MVYVRTEVVGRWTGTADVGGVSVQADLEATEDVYNSGARGRVKWGGTITRDEELESWGLTEPGQVEWIECSTQARRFIVLRASRRLIYIEGLGDAPFVVIRTLRPIYESSGKRRTKSSSP